MQNLLFGVAIKGGAVVVEEFGLEQIMALFIV
jgi:hypothetical protein